MPTNDHVSPQHSLSELADGLYHVLIEREQDALSVRFHFSVMAQPFTGVFALGDEDVLDPDIEPDDEEGLMARDPDEIDTLAVGVTDGREQHTLAPEDCLFTHEYAVDDDSLDDAFFEALFEVLPKFFEASEVQERARTDDWFGVA
jgi:hypothetical protein